MTQDEKLKFIAHQIIDRMQAMKKTDAGKHQPNEYSDEEYINFALEEIEANDEINFLTNNEILNIKTKYYNRGAKSQNPNFPYNQSPV